MAGNASKQKDTAINIKALPVQMHIGSQKYINDDWGTMAYIIDRREIQNKFTDPELRYNCIYFLFGYENTTEMCYVGQAKKRNSGESVLARLREHDQSTTEKYSEVWDWAVVVTNKNDSWTLDDLNALENIFYSEIPAEQRLNGNTPNAGGADFNEYDDKTNQIKALISAIGFSIFTEKTEVENIQVTSETNEFSIVEDLQNGMARIPEIVTPHKVVKAMVDMLPDEVWNSHTVFLDPACKGGEYLREIYDRLMDNELLQSEFPNTIERSNHISNNQIYGIALSQVSLERTTKKLLGFGNNIKIIPNYIDVLKVKFNNSEEKKKYIKEKLKEAFGKEMTFDVVIGNPPYQENTASIYPKFINFSLDISTKVCMITRNNWLKSDTLREVRNKMILTGITDIVNYPKIGDIFKGLGVAVSIFNIDKQHYTGITKYTEIDGKQDYSYNIHLEENGIILRNRLDNDIYQKIKSINSSNGAFSDHVLPTEPFRLTSSGYVGRGDNAYELDIYIDKDNEHDVEVWRMEKSGKPFGGYCKTSDVPSRSDIIDTYKVLCGGRLNNNGIVITNIRPIEKHSICDSSWAVIYYDEDANKTLNAVKYIKTKLFRFLVLLFCDDGMTNISPYRFSLVPLQDFTSNSDIDWSQSISDIDQQLYKKYNLTQDEINYIEKTLKPIQ